MEQRSTVHLVHSLFLIISALSGTRSSNISAAHVPRRMVRDSFAALITRHLSYVAHRLKIFDFAEVKRIQTVKSVVSRIARNIWTIGSDK